MNELIELAREIEEKQGRLSPSDTEIDWRRAVNQLSNHELLQLISFALDLKLGRKS